MTDRYRVLVSCPHAWDGLAGFDALFAHHGIAVDVPEVHGQQLSEADLLEIIGRYDGILAGDDQLTRAVIESAPRLKVISKWGVGIDAIDLGAAEEKGVMVLNTPGVFGEELADYALGFLLLLARRQHIVDRDVRLGRWQGVRGHSLADRTIGIVGLGSSGTALARRALAMSMRVVATDPNVRHNSIPEDVVRMPFEELLETADVVSLHLPAQPGLEPLLGTDAIAQMKPGAWLINTSRGSLVDESALLAALKSGQIGGAALDVFQEEPVRPDHPLLSQPSVVVGAHNGSNTQEAVERTTRAAVENLVAGLTGRR